jgi:hypothetical protein
MLAILVLRPRGLTRGRELGWPGRLRRARPDTDPLPKHEPEVT